MSVHREEKIRICQVPCQPINYFQTADIDIKIKRSCLWCKFNYRKSGYCKNHPAKLQSVFVSSTRSRKQTNDQFTIMHCFLLGGSVYSHFRPWLTIFFLLRLFHSYLYLHILFISLSSLYLRLFFLKSRMPFPPPTDSRGRRRQRISSLRRAMPLTVRI